MPDATMSAAGFVLAINLFIAGIFATAYGVVAAYYRLAIGARWLCAAYAVGILNGLLEFILPYQVDARPAYFAIFAAFLTSMTFCNIGLARHYRVRVPWRLLGIVVLVSVAVNLMTLEMPRGSLLRGPHHPVAADQPSPRSGASGTVPAQRAQLHRQADPCHDDRLGGYAAGLSGQHLCRNLAERRRRHADIQRPDHALDYRSRHDG
jgi:hypothetical protein